MRLIRPVLIMLTAAVLATGAALPPSSWAEPAQAQSDRQNQNQNQNRNRTNANDRERGQDTSGENIDPITNEPVKESSVLDYVNSGYQFAAIIGGLLAVIMLIYAGYRYMTSYGDPEKIADAKDVVEKSLIGLGLLILAALILNTINPRTAQDPCRPGEPGCGDIDFSKPDGGVNRIQRENER